jgi:exodeoxyribonuclease-3
MMLRLATWNVNSVRLRLDQILRFVDQTRPHVLCLQEIKCQAHEFPADAFAAVGLKHLAVHGQKGWHGVALASSLPIEATPPLDICREGHARTVSARIGGLEIHNLYAPAGGDVPDPRDNPKFAHKLDFFDRLTAEMARRDPQSPLVLCGDLNIAPGAHDVWSHVQMSRVVSHTPVEVERMTRLKASLGFVDLLRQARPEPEKVFTWWSYRAADFRASNRGLRLDHIWASPGLAQGGWRAAGEVVEVHDAVRAWDRPSDHAPVTADFAI